MPTSWLNLVASLAVVAAGASIALQQVLNARLRIEIGSPWWAGFTSYLVGTLTMVSAIVASGATPPARAMIARTPWWAWTGGVFGAIFIATAIFAVPRLGAATVLALIIVGQMLGSLVIDHFGLFGLPEHPISLLRCAGAGCLLFGALLIRVA